MKFKEWLLKEMPVGVTKKLQTYYHGTHSQPFSRFDPTKAAKGEQYYNPLGSGLYVTDNARFAAKFGGGRSPLKLDIPPGYRYKRFSRNEWLRAGEDLVKRTLYAAYKMTAIPKQSMYVWWRNRVPLQMMVDIYRVLKNNSPHDGLIEAAEVIRLSDEFNAGWEAGGYTVARHFYDLLPQESDKKFGKYDFVIFDNNDPIEEGKEIVIYNPRLQRVYKAES